MIIKRLGIFSIAKVSGISYAAIGLIFGVLFSFFSIVFGSLADQADVPSAVFGAIFGIGAIIFMPVFYGFFGFIGGAAMAWIYNMVAQMSGGIEIEFESENPSLPNA